MRLDRPTRDDAAAVAAWPASSAEVRDWAGEASPWPLKAEDLQAWHVDPDVLPFVLRDGREAVAYGEIWIDDDEREIELARIIVRPDRRGGGVGRLLVRRLLERPEALAFPVAFVRVAPSNAAALACYRSASFRRVSSSEETAFNRGQPGDYVWLRRDLVTPPAVA